MLNPRTKEYREWLRQAFLIQAKKYIGVPYAKRFHEPGTPLYDSPIFLDCCALVRRVVEDLSPWFGFKLGGGNQGYQFDTFKKNISFDQLRPGDLIFYAGKYYNENHRKQKHDMVHVEIYVGPGEQSIGSRWWKGQIQIFDSFKFVSTHYHSVEHFFCPLEEWLDGCLRFHCKEHANAWRYSPAIHYPRLSAPPHSKLPPTAHSKSGWRQAPPQPRNNPPLRPCVDAEAICKTKMDVGKAEVGDNISSTEHKTGIVHSVSSSTAAPDEPNSSQVSNRQLQFERILTPFTNSEIGNKQQLVLNGKSSSITSRARGQSKLSLPSFTPLSRVPPPLPSPSSSKNNNNNNNKNNNKNNDSKHKKHTVVPPTAIAPLQKSRPAVVSIDIASPPAPANRLLVRREIPSRPTVPRKAPVFKNSPTVRRFDAQGKENCAGVSVMVKKVTSRI